MPILLFPHLSPHPTSADTDELKWIRHNIPTEGITGNWVLAKNSDVRLLTTAIDGTLYCHANPTGTSYTLFKSTDGGYNWSYTGKVEDTIIDIATAPHNAGIIYYATTSRIYRSTDGANTFTPLALNPGGAGAGNIEITSIDVTTSDTGQLIAVGTRDTDNLQYGGIYLLDESNGFNLIDTSLGNYDAYNVAFSPDFYNDRQIIAVVTDKIDTFLTTRFGNEAWDNATARARIIGITPVSASIAFPSNYNAEPATGQSVLFIAINTGAGNGDVYRIQVRRTTESSLATDLNVGSACGLSNTDITGLAIADNLGTTEMLAGSAGTAQVYTSIDSGKSWTCSFKPPTGGSKTGVLFSPDFSRSGRMLAFTTGTESALSVSIDNGVTWNQISLIDTSITTILDLAVSQDNNQTTLFLVTFGGKHSLWRSTDSDIKWERIYSSAPAHIDSLDKVKLSPRYQQSKTVFLAGTGNSNPIIWKSTDNGQNFIGLTTRDPQTGGTFNIDSWEIASDTTLFVGSFDGSKGIVYYSTNGGLFFSTRTVVGTKKPNSIVLSPTYDVDMTLAVGNANGEVFISTDNGVSFTAVPSNISTPPLSDTIAVAFDADYSHNHTLYAASSGANKGIYRFIIGKSADWQSIDGTLPSGGKISHLSTSSSGALYATNFQTVDNANKKGGMERCLNPTYSLGPKFETAISGLKDNATLLGLWVNGNRLYSIDSTNVLLLTYTDSLTTPVISVSPPNKAAGIGTKNATLDWKTINGATSYQWQVDDDTNFGSIATGFDSTTQSTGVKLPALELDTTYYWRVRATEPVLSPWSEKWSFITGLGTEVVTCKQLSPEPAEKNVAIQPVFQWNAISGAERYELMVSADSVLTSPLILKIGDYAVTSTAWQCDVKLNYSSTYYWKVRAISADTFSPWSSVSAFTTESLPKPVITEPPAPSTPVTPSVVAPTTNSTIESPHTNTSAAPQPASPALPPPLSIPPPQTTPDWAKWLLYMGAAFLFLMFTMVLLLFIITIRFLRD